uniref:non-specific serine/threonine protein kinase n=1 Tax=Oryza rufipogon TaxID=4529 RepID=A0A0E0NHG6_ORYRU
MVSMPPSLPPLPLPPQLSLADLKALSVLGRGARGVVFHVVPAGGAAAAVSATADEDPMALKAISRAAARHKCAEVAGGPGGDGHRRIWFERDVLLALRHPLLPSLRGVVATDSVVGFAIDRCAGGDLNALRRRQAGRVFSVAAIRFYAAELVLALEHLHGLGVVYRDLKPENVLIQDCGHIMLVDFDLSTTLPPPPPPPPPDTAPPPQTARSRGGRRDSTKAAAAVFGCFSSRRAAASRPSPSSSSSSRSPPSTSRTASSSSSSTRCSSAAAKSNSFVGTEDYVAPEIVAGSGHDHAVDWWGLGVVLYEMLYGRTPFRGRSRRETFHRVLAARPDMPGEPTPLRDLIGLLLEKDPGRRLGAHGVKRHAFFRGVDWDRVLHVARPPFIPTPDDDDAGAAAEALDVEKVLHEAFAASTAAAAGETAAVETAAPEAGSDRGRDEDFSVFF